MGRAGWHSGMGHADRFKSSGNYVPESLWIPASHMIADNTFSGISSGQISGTFATPEVAHVAGGGGTAIETNVPIIKFAEGTDTSTLLSFITPKSIARNTKAKLKLYWSSSGTDHRAVFWDIDYITTAEWVSGVSNILNTSGIVYTLSGAMSNVTRSGVHFGVPGTLNITELDIPASDVFPEEYVNIWLYRDADETDDNLTAPAQLIGVLVEFVDE